MKIEAKVAEAINEQINAEFWSAYLYLAMSAYWEHKGRTGVAKWFYIQFKEEQVHAELLLRYLLDRDGEVKLAPIAKVKQDWGSLAETFNDTLAHEQTMTKNIYALYTLAEEEKDYATREMLNKLIVEQVEEEHIVSDIIDNLNLVGNDGTGILQIDRELGSRKYQAPSF